MNPSFDPFSQAQWGDVVPNQSANRPVHDFRTSPVLENEGLEGPQVCQQCGKQYFRTCDLNKHLKSHIRPFKCPVEVCRYHMFGWPTEKELDRHYNDKHSMEPRVFSCLWQDCTYTSKRESNCKQHMEKTHGWNYIRSRLGNKEDGPLEQLGNDADLSHLVTYPRGNLTIRTVPGLTFSPSPLEPCLSAPYDSSTPTSLSGAVPFGTDVYIGWSSPVTGPGNNDGFLEEFTQAYAADTQVTSCNDKWLNTPIDPRLYNTIPLGNHTLEKSSTPQAMSNAGESLKVLPTTTTPKTSPDVKTQVLTPLSEPSPVFMQQRYLEGEGATPQDADTDSGRGESMAWGLRSGTTGRLSPHGKRQVRFSKEPDYDSERDDEPPRKRAKAPGGHEDEWGDRRMPCPFRVANPQIYDLNHDQKYYSCHTEHANISTVVRHLGRPAHNLHVDNARHSISSFNVIDNEHGLPKAGLCKKCWRPFTDPETFENHINANCGNVSRSKREKFDIILNTFCRIDPSRRLDSEDEDSEADESGDSEGESEDVVSKSNRATGDGLVRRSELSALAARLTALERAFAQRILPATPRIMPGQTETLVSSSLGAGVQPARPIGNYPFDAGPRPSTSNPTGTRRVAGAVDSDSVHYGNPAGFNQDTDRIMSEFQPSVSRRPDDMSTARRANATNIRHPDSRAGVDQGGPPESSTGKLAYRGTSTTRMANAAAGAVAAAGGGGGGAGDNSGSNPNITRAQEVEYGQEGVSEESANTMMRDRWYQAMDASNAVLESANFFDPPMDDLNRFLEMDSQ